MVSELSFSTYNEVMHSWDRIRRVKDYETNLGILVFSKFLSKHPDTGRFFGMDDDDEAEQSVDSYIPQAKKLVNYCDSFMDMLGPNADMLTDILAEEGRKHAEMGVKLEHYPAMGDALISSVKTLDVKFNDDTELCWRQVYCGLTHDMGKAIIYHRAGRRHTM